MPSPVTLALVTGMGKATDLTSASQAKAHLFSLVEKVKLPLLEVDGRTQASGASLLKLEPTNSKEQS